MKNAGILLIVVISSLTFIGCEKEIATKQSQADHEAIASVIENFATADRESELAGEASLKGEEFRSNEPPRNC